MSSKLAYFAGLLRPVVGGLARYSFLFAFSLSAALGVAVLEDVFNPPNLPAVRPLRDACAVRQAQEDYQRLSVGAPPFDCIRWDRMSPALRLLDRVCPDVSMWVRDEYYGGRLRFVGGDVPYIACYWVAWRSLDIAPYFFEQDVSWQCDTLAHEFRHSQQNVLPMLEALISRWAGRDRTHELVEAEAYRFGHEVRAAVLGGR